MLRGWIGDSAIRGSRNVDTFYDFICLVYYFTGQGISLNYTRFVESSSEG